MAKERLREKLNTQNNRNSFVAHAENELNKTLQENAKKEYKLIDLTLKCVREKNFGLAKKFYDKFHDNVQPDQQSKSKLQAAILSKITTNFTQKDIEDLLDTFKINIKDLIFNHKTTDGDAALATATFIIVNLLNEYSIKNLEETESLLSFFIAKGFPLNAKQSYNNALIFVVSKYPNNLPLIEMLLKHKDVDVNILITPDTDNTCKFAKTPFSAAISRNNMDLLLLLLKHGADPYLAIKTAAETKNGQHKEFIITSGFAHLGLSEQQQQDYFYKVNNLIEDFFLNKLLTEPTTSVQKFTGPEEKEADTEKNKVKLLSYTYKKASTLDKYIDYKKDASKDTRLPEKEREKHTFDSLILEWIKTKNTKHLDSINDLLTNAPADQYNYYLKCLIEMNPSNDEASELLASTPSLLNKFCTLKKKIYGKSTPGNKEKSESLELQDGVYDLECGFKNKIFLKISPKLLKELNAAETEKVLKLLADPKFIKANSIGISGIKDYPGQNISKLKIADKDSNLVSLIRYLDVNGNLVIEFEHYLNHKEIDRLIKLGKNGQCIKCEDIGSMAYKSIEEELATPTAPATPESHDPTVAVLGDDELLRDLD